jgi:OOP family OmpA-OmpF porin
VPDYKDKCPTPAGVVVDATGCAIDSDGDGVRDDVDQCPDTRPGTKVDEFGCPGDADGDGVTDDLDQCPDTPAGWQVDSRGCPVPIVFRNVNFAFDSAELDEEARKALNDQVVAVLRDNPVVRVRVIGHTDSVGTEAYNQALSERRAQSVANYLFSRGVVRDRLETAGRGESDPVAPNSVDAGRAANRRV